MNNTEDLKKEIEALMNEFWTDETADLDGEGIYNAGVYYGLNKARNLVQRYESDVMNQPFHWREEKQ